MKTTNILKLLLVSFLLLIPTIISASSVSAANPVQLIPGQATFIGVVDVSNLQETGQSAIGQNVQGPRHSQGLQVFEQGKAEVGQNGYVPTGEATKTITTSPTTPTPHTTTLGLVLEGAAGGSPNPCGCSPPDVIVGAGPNHVFEMVNLAGIIYTKSGAVAKATFGLDGFFSLPASSMSDPQVSYDASSGRWFASIIDIPNSRVVFAVSTTNDPTGTFNLYSVSDAGHLPDQPVTGTNNDKYVISVNDFNSAGTAYVGVHYWVLNKSELVAGAASPHFATNTPDGNMFSLHPAQHLSSSSTTFYMVTNCTGSCIPSPTSQTTTETVVSITGVPPAAITVSSSSFSIATSVIGPNAAQPGTSTTLTTNDNRVESVVWESNSLWASWNDACIPSGDSATRTCLRLVQATTSGATATKVQDFDFSASGQYYFYPAVTSYQGQLAVSFGRSSSSIYPSAMATGRTSSDALNTLQTPAVIRAGTTADTSTRYGDYFGAATDPSPTAASTFWVAGEYRKSTTFQNWNTVIGQLAAFSAPGSFDFSVSLNPTSGSVVRGSSATSTVTVSLVSGNPASTSLTASVTGTGVTVGVNPTSGNPTYTSTLTITTTSSTPTGSYTVTVTGTSGTLTHSATYALTVTAPAQPDFSLSVSPTSVTVSQGSSGTTTVTLTSLNSFSGTMTLSNSAPPSGTTASFSPATVTLASGGTGTSTLTFTASTTATTGTFTITVTGTSGSLTHSATVSLTVTTTAPPDFSISASPTTVTVIQGSSATSTITLRSLNGFSGTVTLSHSATPSGTTGTFSPTTVTLVSGGTGTSTITFSASPTATTGTFTITITGTSGTLTHSATITLTVNLNDNCNNC